ncbi:hypothetical protein LMH87_002274 [Akanthomyces muscarius]|uniref:Uncharacterized protein n=1 Tax=Akanthomyces muscarius TaxID=2231603 RepID=A0A9W8Q868_AKAMU|nr:hypothetical protein LMH87_002274 [Akanthomyces muscarius]KAJ4147768.1 hypothetical protein LMH87_002274 [Akanthomyces muscarius]
MAVADLESLLEDEEYWDDGQCDLLVPQSTSYDIFQEIPYEEPTYNAIDGILLPTKSSLGVQVCRFSTFQGTLALQPCINHERQHGIFDALEEYEAGDPMGGLFVENASLATSLIGFKEMLGPGWTRFTKDRMMVQTDLMEQLCIAHCHRKLQSSFEVPSNIL